MMNSARFNARKVAEERRTLLVRRALSPCEEPELPASPTNSKGLTTHKGHNNKVVRPRQRTRPTQRNASPGPSSQRLVVNSNVRKPFAQSQKSCGIKRKASVLNTDSSDWSPPPSILPGLKRKKIKPRPKAKDRPTKKKARYFQNGTKFLGTIEISSSSDEAPVNASELFRPEIIDLCSDEEVDKPKPPPLQDLGENNDTIVVSSDDERITAIVRPKTSVPRSIEPRKRAARKRPTPFHSARAESDDHPVVPNRFSKSPIPITRVLTKPDNFVIPLVLQEDPGQQERLEGQDSALASEIIPRALNTTPASAPRCGSIPREFGSSPTLSSSFGQRTSSLQALYKEELSKCVEELPGTSISAFSRFPIPRERRKTTITYSTSRPIAPVLTPLFFSQSILPIVDAPPKSAPAMSLASIRSGSGQSEAVQSCFDSSLLNGDANMFSSEQDSWGNNIHGSIQFSGDEGQLNDARQIYNLSDDIFEEQHQLKSLGDPGKDQCQAYERPVDEAMEKMKCQPPSPQDRLSPNQLSAPLVHVDHLAAVKSGNSHLEQVLVESKTLETILNKIHLPKIGDMLGSWHSVSSAFNLWRSAEDSKLPLPDEVGNCVALDREMGGTSPDELDPLSPSLPRKYEDKVVALIRPAPQESPDFVLSGETHSSLTTKVESLFTVESSPDFSIFDISTITSPDKVDDVSIADLELVYPDDM